VVPQAKGLRLRLSIPFNEINDPKELCLNRKSTPRIKISSLDELPYVMSLVRQALERQLGNEGDDDAISEDEI